MEPDRTGRPVDGEHALGWTPVLSLPVQLEVAGRGPDRGPVPFTPGAEPGGDGIGAVEVSRGVRRREGEDDAVVDQAHLVTDTRSGHGAGTASSEEPTPSPRPGLSGSRRALLMTARVERRAPACRPARPAGPPPTRGATGPAAPARAAPQIGSAAGRERVCRNGEI